MPNVHVVWGKRRHRPDPRHTNGNLRWTFFTDSAVIVDGHSIVEQRLVLDESRPEDSVKKGADPKKEISIHREVYEFPTGTVLTLHMDMGDDKGRFAFFPVDVVCEVVAGGVVVGNENGSISSVKLVKTSWPNADWFLKFLTF